MAHRDEGRDAGRSSPLSSSSPSSSRVFIQCKKCRERILTDFGCSLVSTQEGDTVRHVFSGLDGTGLAWRCNVRDGDELLAVNDIDFKVEKVPHLALVEHLRDSGNTISLLLMRKVSGNDEKYMWVSFRLKTKGGRPYIKRSATTNAGRKRTNTGDRLGTNGAGGLNPDAKLPKWASHPCEASIMQVAYDESRGVRIYVDEGSGSELVLGLFSTESEIEATFTTTDAVMTMHTYTKITVSGSFDIIAAFSSPVLPGHDDDGADTEVECIGGNERGPLSVLNFPSFMTDRRAHIPISPRMFNLSAQNDGTYMFKIADTCKDTLWVRKGQRNRAWLATNALPLSLHFTGEDSARRRLSSSSSSTPVVDSRLYPTLHED